MTTLHLFGCQDFDSMASLQNYNLCDHSVGVDPVPVLRHLDIDPGDVRATPDAPGDQAHHCPSARLGLKRSYKCDDTIQLCAELLT